jgi:hypothetical protein
MYAPVRLVVRIPEDRLTAIAERREGGGVRAVRGPEAQEDDEAVRLLLPVEDQRPGTGRRRNDPKVQLLEPDPAMTSGGTAGG